MKGTALLNSKILENGGGRPRGQTYTKRPYLKTNLMIKGR